MTDLVMMLLHRLRLRRCVASTPIALVPPFVFGVGDQPFRSRLESRHDLKQLRLLGI